MIVKFIRIAIPVLFLFTAVILPAVTSAQSVSEKKTDQYYENFAYSNAVEGYQKLYESDSTNIKYIQRLAYCFDKMLNYPKALFFYERLVQLKQHQPSDLYQYTQLLRIANRIDDYKMGLQKFLVEVPGDQRAIKQLDNIPQLKKLSSNLRNFTINNLAGNTRFMDICPTFYKDRLVYSSAKDSFSMIKNTYAWNNQPFLDLYISQPGAAPDLTSDEPFSKALNSRFHEGPVCFSTDFKTIYFTRNSFIDGKISKTAEGINNLKIFISTFDGKKWGNMIGLAFNSDSYSAGHPALSPDNKTLYFVSDMPGGFGETDLYKSEWHDGTWGKPINLGESVNTPGKEMFPYIDTDEILYFASNGLPGIGGLDIYASKADDGGKFLVVNIGAPVNSPYDDFGFVIRKDSLTGFLSSNRPGGRGDDDNYAFKINKIDLKVVSYDDHTKKILPGTQISLLDVGGAVIDSKISDQSGAAEFAVKPGAAYHLSAIQKTYLSQNATVTIQSALPDFKQEVAINLKHGFPYLVLKVVDKATGKIIPNATVNLDEGKYDPSEYENKDGILRMRLNAASNYSIYASATDYFENSVNFSATDKVPGEYPMTLELEKITSDKQFVIYYDLNKADIRADATSVLNKLGKLLLKYPEFAIKISSHTDSRASALYNQSLSQQRSTSVLNYLIEHDIDKSRVQIVNYGKTQLVNNCGDGVACPEEQHQANRRSVIELLMP